MDKYNYIQNALASLSLLKGKDRDWLRAMSHDDLVKWAKEQYNRNYNQDGTPNNSKQEVK